MKILKPFSFANLINKTFSKENFNVETIGISEKQNMNYIINNICNGFSSFFLPYQHNTLKNKYTDIEFNNFIYWLKQKNIKVDLFEYKHRECLKGPFKWCSVNAKNSHSLMTYNTTDSSLDMKFNCSKCNYYNVTNIFITINDKSIIDLD